MVYSPGTLENDPKKQNMALQEHASKIAANTTSIADRVVGPASSTNNGFAVFDGTTGKLLKDHAATVDLASEVAGNLPVAHLGSGTGAGATTFWRGDAAWSVPVLSRITNSLTGDVALNNTANYFTGPIVAQGSAGVWFASGKVTLRDTSNAAAFLCKLWDGTTVIDSGRADSSAINFYTTISLSGYISSPAADIRISVKDLSTTSGVIIFNASGESKDSTLSAIRIA